MSTISCAIIFAATVIFGSTAHASEVRVQAVSCSPSGGDARLSHANNQATPVVLKNRSDVCTAGFEFLPDPGQMLSGIVLAAPSELGLRAKNFVYRISFQDGSVVHIGELPVSSEQADDGSFWDVFQEGGSVFLNKYEVASREIRLRPVSLELVLDGCVCIQRKNDVWNIETGVKKPCKKIAVASFTSPLCLVHEGGKARLSPRLACKELEDRWLIRNTGK